MKSTMIFVLVLAVSLVPGCRKAGNDTGTPQPAAPQQVHTPGQMEALQKASEGAPMHTGVVQEVLQATSYTYLNVKEGDETFWIAVTKRDMKVGQSITFAQGLEMTNFPSKDLDRTFDTIYFVSEVLGGPPAGMGMSMTGGAQQMKASLEQQKIEVEPAEGGITIGQLYGNRDSYNGKTVVIRGQVTKVNRAIMDRNWVHLQDGTSDSGQFDLTVTTQEDATVGEVATFEGTIVLNKDFGSGYSYEVLMEQANRKSE